MPRPKEGYRSKIAPFERFPGVTTISGTLDDGKADRLIGWTIKEMKAGNDPRQRKAQAADVGTVGHALIELVLGSGPGEVIDLDAALIPYPKELHGPALIVLASFNEWAEEKHIVVRSKEEPMVSEDWRFGSTPDLIFKTKKGLAICDWKSSRDIYPTTWIEMAARKVLWDENYPNEPITAGFHILRLNKSALSFSHHYHRDLPGAWEIFANLLDNYWLLKEFKEHLKGRLS